MSGEYFTTAANSSSSASTAYYSTRWITEEVFKLIDMVQRDEAIYNPRHKYYFCRPYVENFWREVDLKLEKNPGASLAKWTNLRISFRREYTNYLEEKIPPCWSYFDRMFFLHPFLRKKHHTPTKSLDSQVQDALVHISSLSTRLQRERCLASSTVPTSSAASSTVGFQGAVTSQQQPLDSYLFEYFDEAEHNTPELEDIMEEQTRFRLPHDIKSECEDAVDDFELEQVPRAAISLDDAESPEAEAAEVEAQDASALRSSMFETADKRQQLRLQHLNRLQTRSYHDELRAKRPRSHESISSSQLGVYNHGNGSFLRAKNTHVEAVSTTSNAPVEAVNVPIASQNAQATRPHHRLEIPSMATGGGNGAPTAPVEICDCKSDPDAMFLMSLLPDIQKLNGRDRGKIKIAFQNILQDYLYPD